MGVETALLVGGGLSAGIGAISSIRSGYIDNREYQAAANIEKLNARIVQQETDENIRIETENATRIKEAQKLAMIKSGMGLAGSPLLILEDTNRLLALGLDSLQYKSSIENYSSRLKQQSYLASGRAAIIGGYSNAAQNLLNFGLSDSNKNTSQNTGQNGNGYIFNKAYGSQTKNATNLNPLAGQIEENRPHEGLFSANTLYKKTGRLF